MMRMRARTEDILPFALLLPSVIYLGLLILIPMIQALLLAVQADSGTFTTEFIDRMTGDVNFSDAWRNTLLLLVLIVPLQIVLALAMALLIHSRFKGHGIFLYIYAIPLAISDLAAGILWLSVFTERGYLNTVGQGVGLIQTPPVYLSFENFGGLLAAIVIAESWRATAIVMVILVAGLQLIPRDYFEAADLFGANDPRRPAAPAAEPAVRAHHPDDLRLPDLRGRARPGRTQSAGHRGRGIQLVREQPERASRGVVRAAPARSHDRLHGRVPARPRAARS